jgi:hypothetical protein
MLDPALDTLPPPQRRLWAELQEAPANFVLYGGTALVLRFHHRISEDFDFFASQAFLAEELERRMDFLRGAVRLQSAPNTLVCRVDRGGPVKVSFFGGLGLRRVQDPDSVGPGGIRVASLLDLAATKVKAVQDRAESKDYLDVNRLLEEGIDLAMALGAARAVYGPAFNPLLSLKALTYFGDGDLPSLPEDVRSRLQGAAGRTDPTALPEVRALPGGLVP